VKLSILGARVIDPTSQLDQVTDLHLEAGKIVGTMDRDGTTHDAMTALQQRWNQNHWLLQYDLMFGKGYALDRMGMSGLGTGDSEQ